MLALLYQLLLFFVLFVYVTSMVTTTSPSQVARFPALFHDWSGGRMRYTKMGKKTDPVIILIHGFGASYDYYRKQIPAFAANGFQVFAIDLLGFGGSEKVVNAGYSCELWAQQIIDFTRDVVAKENNNKGIILAGNSIGSRISLETALIAPDLVRGLLLYNCAAGINNKFTLTDTLTPFSIKAFAVPIFSLLDLLLKNDGFAKGLFERTRKPENVKATLQSVYVNKDACDEELVESILTAAADDNALKVFVEILTNDAGSTPDTFIDR